MSRQKLLIVENCEPVATVTAAALAGHFENTTAVGTLAEARRLCLSAAVPFGLVICGEHLPDGLGSDFKLWLDELPGGFPAPFILTAGSLPGFRRLRGKLVILPKPFTIDELLDAIDEARVLASRVRPPLVP